MSDTPPAEKSYFQAHVLKESSCTLEAPELHADFAIESARISLANFLRDLSKKMPKDSYRDEASIQQYAAVAVAIEALRQCRNNAPKAYDGIIYDISGMQEELLKRREAELRAARWQKWAMFLGQLAVSALAILAIMALS